MLQHLAVENPTPLAFLVMLQEQKVEGNSTPQNGQDRHMGSASMSLSLNLGVLQGREVDDSDTFKYSEGFTAALFRIKINSIQLKETQEENKKTNDQVLQDRQYQVGALRGCQR